MKPAIAYQNLLMKLMFGMLTFLSGCATVPQDKLTEDLASHLNACVCHEKPGLAIQPWDLSWKDKQKLSEEINVCYCVLKIHPSDVQNPQEYIKQGSEFWTDSKGKPWDRDFEKPYKLGQHLGQTDKQQP